MIYLNIKKVIHLLTKQNSFCKVLFKDLHEISEVTGANPFYDHDVPFYFFNNPTRKSNTKKISLIFPSLAL